MTAATKRNRKKRKWFEPRQKVARAVVDTRKGFAWFTWKRLDQVGRRGDRTCAHLQDRRFPAYAVCRIKIGEESRKVKTGGKADVPRCRTCQRRWLEIKAGRAPHWSGEE